MDKKLSFLYKTLFLFLTSLFAGCTQAPIMQQSYFENVQEGSFIQQIECIYGQPYEVRKLPQGIEEYIYVQRFDLGRSATEQTWFIFTVNQGRIINKKCQQTGTSAIQFYN